MRSFTNAPGDFKPPGASYTHMDISAFFLLIQKVISKAPRFRGTSQTPRVFVILSGAVKGLYDVPHILQSPFIHVYPYFGFGASNSPKNVFSMNWMKLPDVQKDLIFANPLMGPHSLKIILRGNCMEC